MQSTKDSIAEYATALRAASVELSRLAILSISEPIEAPGCYAEAGLLSECGSWIEIGGVLLRGYDGQPVDSWTPVDLVAVTAGIAAQNVRAFVDVFLAEETA